MKITKFSSIDIAIHGDSDLSMDLQTPLSESLFQLGNSKLKSIRQLAKTFDAAILIPNRDVLPNH